MKYTLVLLFVSFIAASCKGQAKNALTSTELELMNFSGIKIFYRSSYNKKDWEARSLLNQQQVSIIIPKLYANFFVELCQKQENTRICDTFRLDPGKRYTFSLSDDQKTILIRHTK